MKKLLLFIAMLLIGINGFSQKKVERLKQYKASNGVTYKVGDSITLNKGSNFNGSFNYVRMSGWGVMLSDSNPEANKLPSTNTGLIVTIKKIKKYNRRRYKGVIFTVGGGNITNYIMEIEPAIANCEVTPCPNKKGTVVVKEDKYDKLKKLKELLDSGILTKAEFEKEKKKILNGK